MVADPPIKIKIKPYFFLGPRRALRAASPAATFRAAPAPAVPSPATSPRTTIPPYGAIAVANALRPVVLIPTTVVVAFDGGGAAANPLPVPVEPVWKRPRPGGAGVEVDIQRPPPRPAGHRGGSGAPVQVMCRCDSEWGAKDTREETQKGAFFWVETRGFFWVFSGGPEVPFGRASLTRAL